MVCVPIAAAFTYGQRHMHSVNLGLHKMASDEAVHTAVHVMLLPGATCDLTLVRSGRTLLMTVQFGLATTQTKYALRDATPSVHQAQFASRVQLSGRLLKRMPQYVRWGALVTTAKALSDASAVLALPPRPLFTPLVRCAFRHSPNMSILDAERLMGFAAETQYAALFAVMGMTWGFNLPTVHALVNGTQRYRDELANASRMHCFTRPNAVPLLGYSPGPSRAWQVYEAPHQLRIMTIDANGLRNYANGDGYSLSLIRGLLNEVRVVARVLPDHLGMYLNATILPTAESPCIGVSLHNVTKRSISAAATDQPRIFEFIARVDVAPSATSCNGHMRFRLGLGADDDTNSPYDLMLAHDTVQLGTHLIDPEVNFIVQPHVGGEYAATVLIDAPRNVRLANMHLSLSHTLEAESVTWAQAEPEDQCKADSMWRIVHCHTTAADGSDWTGRQLFRFALEVPPYYTRPLPLRLSLTADNLQDHTPLRHTTHVGPDVEVHAMSTPNPLLLRFLKDLPLGFDRTVKHGTRSPKKAVDDMADELLRLDAEFDDFDSEPPAEDAAGIAAAGTPPAEPAEEYAAHYQDPLAEDAPPSVQPATADDSLLGADIDWGYVWLRCLLVAPLLLYASWVALIRFFASFEPAIEYDKNALRRNVRERSVSATRQSSVVCTRPRVTAFRLFLAQHVWLGAFAPCHRRCLAVHASLLLLNVATLSFCGVMLQVLELSYVAPVAFLMPLIVAFVVRGTVDNVFHRADVDTTQWRRAGHVVALSLVAAFYALMLAATREWGTREFQLFAGRGLRAMLADALVVHAVFAGSVALAETRSGDGSVAFAHVHPWIVDATLDDANSGQAAAPHVGAAKRDASRSASRKSK